MSFQTGLSGLNASSKGLDVIGNNIANANTVGMKASRAEFADLVASSLGSGGGGAGAGIGVSVATVAQQFTQGNISVTGNSLDVAINGSGFFQITKPDGTAAYTRDGQFKLDKDGYILTNSGANVMGYPTDPLTGQTTSITPQKMQLPTGAPIGARATTAITAEINLDSRVPIATTTTPVTPAGTYGTAVTLFDSQGNSIPQSFYFSKLGSGQAPVPTAANTDQWAIYDSANAVPGTTTPIAYVTFTSSGALEGTYDGTTLAATAAPGIIPLTIPNTAKPVAGSIAPSLDLRKLTQYGSAFSVSKLTQDGYTAGSLTGLSIEPSGVITTRYSNGQTQSSGQIALADFRNIQGLTPIGGGEYLETSASGQPIQGAPGVGNFGALRSGALEDSNVDLTAELVNMMTAQRNYQANAQTIKTQDQIMSTLVNLR